VRDDPPRNEARYVPPRKPKPVAVKSETVYVLGHDEVAARLQVSRGGVDRMIAARKMRSLVLGRTVVVPSDEIEKHLHS